MPLQMDYRAAGDKPNEAKYRAQAAQKRKQKMAEAAARVSSYQQATKPKYYSIPQLDLQKKAEKAEDELSSAKKERDSYVSGYVLSQMGNYLSGQDQIGEQAAKAMEDFAYELGRKEKAVKDARRRQRETEAEYEAYMPGKDPDAVFAEAEAAEKAAREEYDRFTNDSPLDIAAWTSRNVPEELARDVVKQDYIAAKKKEYAAKGISDSYAGYLADADYKKALLDYEAGENSRRRTLEDARSYAEKQRNLKNNRDVTEANLMEINSMSEDDREAFLSYMASSVELHNSEAAANTTQYQEAVEALSYKYDEKRLRELAETYGRYRNQLITEEAARKAEDLADENIVSRTAGYAATFPLKLVGAITGPLDSIGSMAAGTGQYVGPDTNGLGNLPNVFSDTLRSQMTREIRGDGSNHLKNFEAMAFQAVSTTGDSLLRAYTAGPWSLALSGSATFNETLLDATKKGASSKEAVALAVINAGIETATEKIPLDNLLGNLSKNPGSWWAVLKKAGGQAFTEISTEELSLIGTTLMEAAILRESSDEQAMIRELEEKGYTHAQAADMVNRQFLNEAVETLVVSGLSGFASSVGTSITGAARNPNMVTPPDVDVRQNQDGTDQTGQQLAQELLKTNPPVDAPQAVTPEQQAMDAAYEEITGQKIPAQATPALSGDAATGLRASNELQQAQQKRGTPTYEELVRKGDIPVVDVGRNTEGKTYAQLKDDVWNKAAEQKWYDTPYTNKDTGMPVFLTEKSLTHAFSNLSAQFGTDTILAMGNAPELIENAVLTDIAPPKNPAKAETRVLTFFAAINGENGIEPVKLTVKEYSSNTGNRIPEKIAQWFSKTKRSETYNRLYDLKALEVVSIESAKKEFGASANDPNSLGLPGAKSTPNSETGASVSVADGLGHPLANNTPNSNISIEDLMNLVKGDAEKYIPKPGAANIETGTKPIGELPNSALIATSNSPSSANSMQQQNGDVNGNLQGEPAGMDTKTVPMRSGQAPEGDKNLSAAEAGYTGKQDYYDLLTDDNVQPARDGDVRKAEVPIRDGNGRKVTEFAANAINSPATTEQMADSIERLIASGELGHDVRTNRESLNRAAAIIERKGIDRSIQDFRVEAARGKTSPDLVAMGRLLYEYVQHADIPNKDKSQSDIFTSLSQLSTSTGRSLQLFSLFRKMSVDGQVETIRNDCERMVERMQRQGRVKKDFELSIDETLLSDFRSAAGNLKKAQANAAGKGGEATSQEYRSAKSAVDQAQRDLDIAEKNVQKAEAASKEAGEIMDTALPDAMEAGRERASAQNQLKAAREELRTAKAVRDQAQRDLDIADRALQKIPELVRESRELNKELYREAPAATRKRLDAEAALKAAREERNKAKKDLERAQKRLESAQKSRERAAAVNQETDTIRDAEKKLQQTQNAIYQSVAAQMPATFAEKWNAWRYMSMLGNVKTNIRNFFGNAFMVPFTEAKRTVGTALERAFLPQNQRTKAVLGFSQGDVALKKWAREDASSAAVKDALEYSAKLGDDVAMQKAMEGRRIFDSDVLETYRKLSEYLPAAGDMLFKNREYAASLAGFLKARGYTAEDAAGGAISENILMEARTYAIEEAMRATFNDANAVSDLLSSLGRNSENPFGKVANLMVEGVIPFRRTPANIAVRAVEYSPIGLAKSIKNLTADVKSGKMSAATALDRMSAGLVGSGAWALGMLLRHGVFGFKIIGKASEEEKEAGYMDYSIVLPGGHNYSVEWCAPANIPFFVGANIYDAWAGDGYAGDLSALTQTAYAVMNIFDPMLSLSCLSSLNDFLESGKYAEDGAALYTVIANAATSYLLQAIPSPLRQAAQAAQKNREVTFANSADPLIRDLQRTVARVPFVGELFKTDAVDEWGRTESRGSIPWRIFDAFLNPGQLKKIETTELGEEIARLNAVQPDSVTPPDTPKTITYTDKDGLSHKDQRLTGEQYTTLARAQGETALRILEEAISSDIYQALTDDQKEKVFDYVYDYAREKGRTEAIYGYDGMDSWMRGIDGKEVSAIMNKVAGAEFTNAFKSVTQAWDSGRDAPDLYDGLNQSYDIYNAMPEEDRAAFLKESGGRVEYFIKARDAGMSTEAFAGLFRQYREIDAQDKDPGRKAQDWAYTLETAEDSGEITAQQKALLKEEMGFRYSMQAGTGTFDSMLEEGIGTDVADALIRSIKNAKGTGSVDPETGERRVTDMDKYKAVVGSAGVTNTDKDKAMHALLPDYDPADKRPERAEVRYDYARKKLGVSPQEYVSVWQANAKYSKKADKEAAWKAMGYTKSEVDILYKLFNADKNDPFTKNLLKWYEAQG